MSLHPTKKIQCCQIIFDTILFIDIAVSSVVEPCQTVTIHVENVARHFWTRTKFNFPLPGVGPTAYFILHGLTGHPVKKRSARWGGRISMNRSVFIRKKKKIDGIRFFFFDMKANLSTDIFPTLKMVEWRSPVLKSNFPPDHPLGLLNAATLAIQGHKTHTAA